MTLQCYTVHAVLLSDLVKPEERGGGRGRGREGNKKNEGHTRSVAKLTGGKRGSHMRSNWSNKDKERNNERKDEGMQNEDVFIKERKQLQFSP